MAMWSYGEATVDMQRILIISVLCTIAAGFALWLRLPEGDDEEGPIRDDTPCPSETASHNGTSESGSTSDDEASRTVAPQQVVDMPTRRSLRTRAPLASVDPNPACESGVEVLSPGSSSSRPHKKVGPTQARAGTRKTSETSGSKAEGSTSSKAGGRSTRRAPARKKAYPEEVEEEESDEVEYLGTGAPEINTGWVKERQLGESGKEGTVYEVKHEAAERCAMKEFKAKKATSTFLKEVQFQRDAALVGAAPAVRGVMRNPPRLVMEPMVRTLQQVLESQHGSLTPAQQKDLIQLCGRLDGAGIYHNDPNPLNLMEDCDGKFKWIDYGMSKAIDVSKNGRKPNTRALHAMLHGGMQGLVSRKVWTGDHSLLTKAIEGSQK